MNDGTLFAFGCAVMFTALAGAYVYVRERFEHRAAPARQRARTSDRRRRGLRRVA